MLQFSDHGGRYASELGARRNEPCVDWRIRMGYHSIGVGEEAFVFGISSISEATDDYRSAGASCRVDGEPGIGDDRNHRAIFKEIR